MLIFGVAAGLIAVFLVSGVLSAWVLAILWGWFVHPIFGLPDISLVEAMGLTVIVRLLVHTDYTAAAEKYKNAELAEIFGMAVGEAVGPLGALLIGWVLYRMT